LYGQLGDGTQTAKMQVTTTTTFSDWTDVAAGDIHTCGIRANGTMWCWGHGDGGQLGLGTVPYASPSPMQVGTATTWASVVAGNHHTCALQTDGSRWCWGENGVGSLGDGQAWVPGFVVVANGL
jgi:alpha-tubulin suppressor-like RCC1 family protein